MNDGKKAQKKDGAHDTSHLFFTRSLKLNNFFSSKRLSVVTPIFEKTFPEKVSAVYTRGGLTPRGGSRYTFSVFASFSMSAVFSIAVKLWHTVGSNYKLFIDFLFNFLHF
jgi:hypothetical protein